MRRKHKVVALPTEKVSKLHLQNNKEWLYYKTGEHKGNTKIVPHHLYITSDEEIKKTDWYIHYKTKELCQWDGGLHNHPFAQDRKIVATTNPELWGVVPIRPGSKSLKEIEVPKISEDFIEAFAREQGIWEVELEIDNHLPDTDGDFGKPKLRPNGTVIIHPVQEKKFTMKEMVDFVMWYSGMTQEKVVNAYNRYVVEKPE